MKDSVYYVGFAFSILSLCTTLTVIFLHIKIPKLLKHPGQYVFVQIICQLFYDLHWCISFPRFDKYSEYSVLCEIEAILILNICNLGVLYVTILGIELSIKFKFQGSIAYFKRSLIYNATCILVLLVNNLLIALYGQLYLTEFFTCSVYSLQSNAMQVMIFTVCTVIMVFALAYMMCKKNKNNVKVIKNFAFIILFVILTWIVPSTIVLLSNYVTYVYFKEAAYLLGTISGTCIGLSRIINYKVLSFFHSKIRKPSKPKSGFNTFSLAGMNESLNYSFINKAQSLNDFGEFYEDQSVKVIKTQTFIEIMCALGLHFYDKEEPPSKEPPRRRGSKLFKRSKEPQYVKTTKKYNIHKQKTELIEYELLVFEQIRGQYFHTSQNIYESICDPANLDIIATNLIVNSSNGSMIFITADQKYVVKVITKHEKSVFVEILLEGYMNRVLFHKESKLVRILGLFQIKPAKIFFLLMENTAALDDTSLRFDLKGSTVDRFVTHSVSSKSILKDVNFLKSNIKVQLPPESYKSLIKTLTDDFQVLRSANIMDYSLYLVYHTLPATTYPHYTVSNFSISIIDLFQLYDSQKAFERCLKIYVRCVKKHSLSSVSSTEYFNRLINFLPIIFECIN